MVEPTQGYITKSGRFFENKLDAEINEAEETLRERLDAIGDIDADGVVVVLTKLAVEAHRYTTALLEKARAEKSSEASITRAEGAPTDRQTDRPTNKVGKSNRRSSTSDLSRINSS